MKRSRDAFVTDITANQRDEYAAMAAKSREELERRYRACRGRINDLQAGQILQMFTDGKSSSDIARALRIPLHTVRSVISYACSQSILLYRWHSNNLPGSYRLNSDAPLRPDSYIRYAPVI